MEITEWVNCTFVSLAIRHWRLILSDPLKRVQFCRISKINLVLQSKESGQSCGVNVLNHIALRLCEATTEHLSALWILVNMTLAFDGTPLAPLIVSQASNFNSCNVPCHSYTVQACHFDIAVRSDWYMGFILWPVFQYHFGINTDLGFCMSHGVNVDL